MKQTFNFQYFEAIRYFDVLFLMIHFRQVKLINNKQYIRKYFII